MKLKKRQICIIGLGHFGFGLACSLAKHGEVLALDNNMNRVNAVTNHVQRALCVDAKDFEALSSVVSQDFDEAVVSIGDNIEDSILCTLHLKKIGVPVIRAKANSTDHAEILRSVGATQVIFPELESAERLALQILNPNLLDFIPLMNDYQVMDVSPPASFRDKTLAELHLRNRFGIFVIAVKKHDETTFLFLPGPEHKIGRDDILVVIGKKGDILALQDASDQQIAPKSDQQIAPKNGGKENAAPRTNQ